MVLSVWWWWWWCSHRWVKSMENLLSSINVVPEGFMQEFEFLCKTVGIIALAQ
jgi:hypothetical protein